MDGRPRIFFLYFVDDVVVNHNRIDCLFFSRRFRSCKSNALIFKSIKTKTGLDKKLNVSKLPLSEFHIQ